MVATVPFKPFRASIATWTVLDPNAKIQVKIRQSRAPW
jgi:hypothetical protein